MYIANARTLKVILDQLSDTSTFSEQRDQLLSQQQDRSFRFILRFHEAENSYGYESNHPLRDGYTVHGELTDSPQQVRVSLDPGANTFVESLRKGDTLELVATLHRWDPAYDVVEMESVLDNALSSELANLLHKNSPQEDLAKPCNQALRHPTTLPKKSSSEKVTFVREKTSPVKNESADSATTSGRTLTGMISLFGFIGCALAAALIFLSSQHAADWVETPAKLIFYKNKNRVMFITYVYTVDQTEYRRTEPVDKHFGPAGNYFWVDYQKGEPTMAQISQRRDYNKLLTGFTVGPFLLIFFLGTGIIISQITQTPSDMSLARNDLEMNSTRP